MRRVLFEKFLVFLLTLRCEVVISWDLSGVLNAVVGPLGYNGEVDHHAGDFFLHVCRLTFKSLSAGI